MGRAGVLDTLALHLRSRGFPPRAVALVTDVAAALRVTAISGNRPPVCPPPDRGPPLEPVAATETDTLHVTRGTPMSSIPEEVARLNAVMEAIPAADAR